MEVETMNDLTFSPALGWPAGGVLAAVMLAAAIIEVVLHIRRAPTATKPYGPARDVP